MEANRRNTDDGERGCQPCAVDTDEQALTRQYRERRASVTFPSRAVCFRCGSDMRGCEKKLDHECKIVSSDGRSGWNDGSCSLEDISAAL